MAIDPFWIRVGQAYEEVARTLLEITIEEGTKRARLYHSEFHNAVVAEIYEIEGPKPPTLIAP